jgi:hypothetical protein
MDRRREREFSDVRSWDHLFGEWQGVLIGRPARVGLLD